MSSARLVWYSEVITVALTGPGPNLESGLSLWRYWMPVVLLALVCVALVLNRQTRWRRLAEVYPAAPPGTPARRIFASRVVVGKGFYKNTTWLQVDDTHLHVSGMGPSRLWLPTFSVPWADISAAPDEYPWGLWNSRVVGLTFARDPEARFLVWPTLFDELGKVSSGRLRLTHPDATPAGTRNG